MIKKSIILCIFLFVLVYTLAFAQEQVFNGSNNETNITVEYDPEILDEFNNNQTWVSVLIRLKDNSDIDSFLNSLSAQNFDGERGSSKIAFVGWVTREGFSSLIEDSRVKSISWTKFDVHTTREKNITSEENIPEYSNISNKPELEENHSNDEQIIEKKPISFFSRVILFFKNLFGIE